MARQLTLASDTADGHLLLARTQLPELMDALPKGAQGSVHLLRLAQIARRDWALLMGLLDAAERQRAARFRFEGDRDAYIAAHGLLRLAIASRLGANPAELRLSHQPGKKPALISEDRSDAAVPAIDFSLSHTRSCVGCIVAEGISVGIDIEPTRDPPAQGEGPLSPQEIAWLRTRPPRSAAAEFTKLWCRKEALLKSLGSREPMSMSRFSAIPGQAIALPAGSGFPAQDISVTSHLTDDGIHIAIAVRSAVR
ncbi:4'-phosphopantetheinyl transferase superfamily protein [Bosea sp. 2YAB26]|uniref:4'-phosphopantetheinyl transferase family protein n=1 Tax=Bosea sp. 2YAB26 TaxID=3237478 RepID=UPI003F904DF9